LFRRATPSFRHFRLKIKGVRWQWSSTPALLFSRLQFSVSSSGRCGCGSSIDFRFVVVIFLEGKLFYRSIDFAIYLRALCEGGGGGVGLYSRQDRCWYSHVSWALKTERGAKGYWWHFQFYLLPIIIINVSFASTKMKIKTSQANNFCFPFKYSILDAWLAGRAKKKQQQRLHQKNVNRIIGRSRQQQQWGRERDSRRDKEREGAFETHRELMFISIAGNFVNYDRQTLLPREREGYSWREREGARSWYTGKRGHTWDTSSATWACCCTFFARSCRFLQSPLKTQQEKYQSSF